jgi:hypothetical protein
MMGKLNILGLIATEDGVFRETNIVGEMIGNTYKKGRHAVNQFEPGARIEKPSNEQLGQVWQAISVLERQFRVVSNYDVSQDGQNPSAGGWATGQSIRELSAGANDNVREYQTAIRHSIELIDRKRLEWDEKMHASETKRIYWYEGSAKMEETYTPKIDINGDYRTKRVYGAMATFDENQKVVTGLQLLQARTMDRRTFMENLDGLDNISLILERIDQDGAKEQLLGALGAMAAEQDPKAMMALIEINKNPGNIEVIMDKLFTAEEPQMSPEEMAMMGAGGMPGGPGGPGGELAPPGPPPAVQTALTQLEAPGGGGGIQTVGRTA